ncbi:MAG: hypothetical protein B6D46_09145 [Polyangiaceae bacterium UTPRO1]|jgi:mono/diheme cytochrome c family protein|nr:hypothetical protein [Myxococcales bacterium]OQY66890.1 MAG: hypothetical protein B6D46_09145 [Polyangiaceae bacterium UTPRO1]
MRRALAAALLAIGLALPAPAAAADRSAPEPVAARDAAADALAVHDYLLSCGGCHALDGSGSEHVPALRGLDRLLARPGGRAYLVRVPGVTNAPLSDARLAALLDWIFVNFGNRTPAGFSAEEVAAGRAAPLVDPIAARAALE